MPSVHKFKRGFKKFADDKSIEFRKALGIKPSHPLPAVKLADHLKAKIIFPADIPLIMADTLACLLKGPQSAWSGVALQVREKVIIIINSSHSLARQESTIMHELAHLICGHQMGKFEILGEGIALRSFDASQEAEADWLGSCLQLPGVALYYCHEDGLSHDEIATKFNASNDMVRYRMNICGIGKRKKKNI